ncbi:MAG: restriction endonuclease [Chloroflexi bacterium]|nr:restriction endonuclease [Chloroflexota bacterium]
MRPTPTPVTPVPPPSPPPNHLRQRLRERLLQTSPAEFERVVGKFLGALGLSEIHVTGRTADGGIDGNGIVPVFNLKVCFQAKRWAMGNNVGSSPVRELVGSVTTRRYDKGVFITTSAFTAGAREEAEGTESKVVLIDGDRLVDMMIEKGLGIREVTVVTQQELDEEFFQEL